MMTEILAAAGAAVFITAVTRAKNALTWPAALMADAMLIFITCMSGLQEAMALIGMYLAVFVVDMIFGKKMEHATKEIQGKGGIRGIKQVLANGAAGCFCIFLYRITGESAFLIAYYASIFEVMADSIASDVGVLSKRPPRDICTWKVVSRGISGGVSVLGLLASGLVCVAGGLAAGAILHSSLKDIMIIILAPYLGMLTDSVIGSLIQVKYTCCVCGIQTERTEHCGKKTMISGGCKKISNSMVNTICTVVAAIAACLFAIV